MGDHEPPAAGGSFPPFANQTFEASSRGQAPPQDQTHGQQQQAAFQDGDQSWFSAQAGPPRGRGASNSSSRGGRGRGAMTATFEGAGRGTRGGRGGTTGVPLSISRPRVAAAAGDAPATRGGRAAFANRSVVFKKPAHSGKDQEDHEQVGDDFADSQDVLQHNQNAGATPGSFSTQAPIPSVFDELNTQPPEPLPFLQRDDEQFRQADNEAERKKRFENLSKQNRFFEMRTEREALRARYIASGILPDPDKPQDLAAAKIFRGTCMEMCPEFEREEREFQNEGDPLEMFPGSTRLDPLLAVKIYRRPAAGRELPLPEDVRPPEVLRQTLDYLLHDLLPSDPSTSRFTAVQRFMWNRTRAIRQDFIVQGERGPLAIECHERIARYHILCLHWRGGVGADGWSEQQELEQLRKTIRSLTEFYEDLRRSKGLTPSNEAEFRAYNLLLHMSDPETLREVEALPSEVSDSAPVQAALELRMYAQRSNNTLRRGRPANSEASLNLWTRFFGKLRKRDGSISYLLACLAENAFSHVRAGALKAMGKTYLSQHAPLPLDYLRRSLGMDSDEEVRSFGVALGCEEVRADGVGGQLIGLRLTKANDDVPLPSAPFSKGIVERKRGSWTTQDIVDGKASGAAALLTLPDNAQEQGAFSPPVRLVTSQKPMPPVMATQAPVDSMKASPSFATVPDKPARNEQNVASAVTLSASAPSFTPLSFSTGHLKGTGPKSVSQTPLALPGSSTGEDARSGTSIPSFGKIQSQTFGASPSASAPVDPQAFSIPRHPIPEPKPQVPSSAKAPEVLTAIKAVDTPASAATNNTSQGIEHPSNAVKPNEPSRIPNHASQEKTLKNTNLQGDGGISTSRQQSFPKRNKASIAKALFVHLLTDFLNNKTYAVAEQACRRESRVRRELERGSFVQRSAAVLTASIFESVIEDSLVSIGSMAIANDFSLRCTQRRALLRWRESLEKLQERRRQTERLYWIRRKLSKQPIRNKGSKKDGLHAISTIGEADISLKDNISEARSSGESLWSPFSFLWTIALRVEERFASCTDLYVIALSVGNKNRTSSRWLSTKFGLEKVHVTDVKTRDNTIVRAIDLKLSRLEELRQERHLGVVVFELEPWPETDSATATYWEGQRARLQNLSQSDLVRHSQFLPKLLIVSWKDKTVEALDAEMIRREHFQHLSLKAADENRSAWSSIELYTPGLLGSSEDWHSNFEERINHLLGSIELNKHSHRITFDDVVSITSHSWLTFLERVDSSLFLTTKCTGQAQDQIILLAVKAFGVTSRLLLRTIEDIIAVSVSDEEKPFDVSDALIASIVADTSRQDALTYIYEVAAQQLSDIRKSMQASRLDDSDVAHLLKWLSTWRDHAGSAFPWRIYFTQLFQSLLAPMRSSWLEPLLPSLEDIQAEAHTTTQLCQQAADEFHWRARELIEQHGLSVEKDVQHHETDEETSFAPPDSERTRPGSGQKRRTSSSYALHDQDSNKELTRTRSVLTPIRPAKKGKYSDEAKSLLEPGRDVLARDGKSQTIGPKPALIDLRGLIASSNDLLARDS